MDSITHIVLGACIGEALAGRKIGKKALVIGAAAQSIPDIDFVASFWMEPAEELIAHRGLTHSFLFVLLLSPLLAFVIQRSIKTTLTVKSWTILFLVEMLVHLFLDAFNNYGVGWFEPFSSKRVSFNTIYVADPLMTIFPLVACFALLILPTESIKRKKWWRFGIAGAFLYMCVCLVNKIYVTEQAKDAFVRQGIPHKMYFTTPAPLQSFLWMVVAGDSAGFNIAYRSVFDSPEKINFGYFPVNEHMLDTLIHHSDVEYLKTFSQGFYTVEKWGDTLVFSDLRFGQILGWQDPKERFVFHYFLQHPGSNTLIVQRGRFAKWDRKVLKRFLQRIRGI